MKTRFDKEIKRLSSVFEDYTGLVKKIFQEGLLSLENGDKELARKVIKDDRKIDLTEVEIEEACLLSLRGYLAKPPSNIILCLFLFGFCKNIYSFPILYYFSFIKKSGSFRNSGSLLHIVSDNNNSIVFF